MANLTQKTLKDMAPPLSSVLVSSHGGLLLALGMLLLPQDFFVCLEISPPTFAWLTPLSAFGPPA